MITHDVIRNIYLNNSFTYKQLEQYIKEMYGEQSVSKEQIFAALNDENIDTSLRLKLTRKKQYIEEICKNRNPYLYTMTSTEINRLNKMIRKKDLSLLTPHQLLIVKAVYLYLLNFSIVAIADWLSVNCLDVQNLLDSEDVESIFHPNIYHIYIEKMKNDKNLHRYDRDSNVCEKAENFEFLITSNLLQKEIPTNISGRRYNTLLSIISTLYKVDIFNYDQLAKKCNLKKGTIYKYLHDDSLLHSVFVETVYEEIKIKVHKLDVYEEEKKQQNKTQVLLRDLDESVDAYLHSRFTIKEHETKYQRLGAWVTTDFFKEHYGEEIIMKIREKAEEIKNMKIKLDSQYELIREANLIQITKPSITTVTLYEKKILTVVSLFFEYFGNIEFMLANSNVPFPGYSFIYYSLIDLSLERLLKEESYKKLQTYLKVEQSFFNSEKRTLIKSMVESYFMYYGNIFKLQKDLQYSEEEIMRLLTDKYVAVMYGDEIAAEIVQTLRSYREKKYVIEELESVKYKKLVDIS